MKPTIEQLEAALEKEKFHLECAIENGREDEIDEHHITVLMHYLKQAIAVAKGDMVVVPREPTQGFPSMAQIGAATMWDVTEQGKTIGHPQATAVYKAMIKAAEKGV